MAALGAKPYPLPTAGALKFPVRDVLTTHFLEDEIKDSKSEPIFGA